MTGVPPKIPIKNPLVTNIKFQFYISKFEAQIKIKISFLDFSDQVPSFMICVPPEIPYNQT
jgi:hypothetical protein